MTTVSARSLNPQHHHTFPHRRRPTPGWARLLSGVAVVGRENEPLYLRGDLCDCMSSTQQQQSQSQPASPVAAAKSKSEAIEALPTDAPHPPPRNGDDSSSNGNEDANKQAAKEAAASSAAGEEPEEGEHEEATATSASESSLSNDGRNIVDQIRGGRNAPGNDGKAPDGNVEGGADSKSTDADEDDEDDDPFGFFGSGACATADEGSAQGAGVGGVSIARMAPMSLTQQLVLHASLDRFEEIASQANRGGTVRWRTPGSTGASAMWVGLLCAVEERWTVYGYMTNTGIKFMILVEEVFLTAERIRTDSAAGSSSIASAPSSNRETELKTIFAQLHELYVRYHLNPFSKLRSPIKSKAFDLGIVQMALAFNDTAAVSPPLVTPSSSPSLQMAPKSAVRSGTTEESLKWM